MSSALLLDRHERKQPSRRVVTLTFALTVAGTGDERDAGGFRDLGVNFPISQMIVRQVSFAATAVNNTVLLIGCDFAADRILATIPAATAAVAPNTTFTINSILPGGLRKFNFWQNGTSTRSAIDGVLTLTLEFIA